MWGFKIMIGVEERCVDSNNALDYVKHNIIEYNNRKIDIGDNYLVVINMKNSPLFFGYKKEGKWYTDGDELIENEEDIISFFDHPLPAFYCKRHK